MKPNKSISRENRLSYSQPLMISTFGSPLGYVGQAVNMSQTGLLLTCQKTPFNHNTLVEVTLFDNEGDNSEKFWAKIVRRKTGRIETIAVHFILDQLEDRKRMEIFFKNNVMVFVENTNKDVVNF